jgi:hypothetical protein
MFELYAWYHQVSCVIGRGKEGQKHLLIDKNMNQRIILLWRRAPRIDQTHTIRL